MSSLRYVMYSASIFASLFLVSAAQSSTTASTTVTATFTTSQPTAAPTCANSCVGTATLTQSCAPGDQACLCLYSTQIQESIYNCLITTSAKCSDEERTQAFEYYPVFCRNLNLAVETNVPTVLMTAASTTPTEGSTLDTDGSSSGSAILGTTGTSSSSKSLHGGLQLPAILGITLVVVVMMVIVVVIMVWSYFRRRQALRRPRMDLGGELAESKPRPPRSTSINSEFMVQPSPVEKNSFGTSLSRTSTLVPPPPIAKDDKRDSDEKRNSARNKTLKTLLGADGLRSSLLSRRFASREPSLVVDFSGISKDQSPKSGAGKEPNEEIRFSKF